jgi:hypothetical protein
VIALANGGREWRGALVVSRVQEGAGGQGGEKSSRLAAYQSAVRPRSSHRANLMLRLGSRNSTVFTMFAVRHGLVSSRTPGSNC